MKSFFFSMAILCTVLCDQTATAQCIASGPFNATLFSNNTSAGTVPWNNPGNVATSDNNLAQASQLLSLFATANTNYLVIQGLGFSIPAAATICGISVSIERSAGGLSLGGAVKDAAVRIIKNGSITGVDHALAAGWPGSDATTTYGSPSDIWGVSWTPADINAADFGIAIAASLSAGLLSVAMSARIDHITITVYYLNPSILPVALDQFTVTASDHVNIISWVSVKEDMRRLTVERLAGGRNWQIIGALEAQGTIHQYVFADRNPPQGNAWYRLAIEDNNGKIDYSAIRQVWQQSHSIGLFPNPAKDVINITGTRRRGIIVIKDLQGRQISTFNIDPSIPMPQLSLAGIKPGLYLVEIDGMVLRLQIK